MIFLLILNLVYNFKWHQLCILTVSQTRDAFFLQGVGVGVRVGAEAWVYIVESLL